MGILDQIKSTTITGDRDKTVDLINQAIDAGMKPGDIIQDALIAAMSVVGERFKSGEIYVPEMLIAARAMQSGLDLISPLLEQAGQLADGRAVESDLGKRIDELAGRQTGWVDP